MKPYPILVALAAVLVIVAHYLVFVHVPMEATMGAVQRIFYFHVPSAMLCYLGFIGCFVASIGYLLNRKAKWDAFAFASAELGLVFGLIMLTTGPLWARPVWGVWWNWEPRLTSASLLVLIFAAYWVLRSFGGAGEGVRRFAAVLAVFGTPNIYFVRLAVERWGGVHPNTGVAMRSDPTIRATMYICLAILLLVFALLLVSRYRLHRDTLTVRALRRRLARLGGLS
ncbi:MAG: cytochrome c biogenesis protein CcsA [bacterium]|nr:cytochrome c biogenesis protein CcsA [Myxococcales bacterium]MCB9552028.1 cytochrome c biogenesis protein CcsA [Myxococcales bacterium]